MTFDEFKGLVGRYMDARRAWEKHKRREDLHLAQRLERQVDTELKHPGLFDDHPTGEE